MSIAKELLDKMEAGTYTVYTQIVKLKIGSFDHIRLTLNGETFEWEITAQFGDKKAGVETYRLNGQLQKVRGEGKNKEDAMKQLQKALDNLESLPQDKLDKLVDKRLFDINGKDL